MARRRAKGRDVNGILLLDKPTGMSSNAALQTVKRLFNASKAGHTGNLDPLATVYFTVLGEKEKVTPIQQALEKASGFLRHALGENMVMRSVPHLKFVYDDSISRGATLSSLIDEAVATDRKKHQDSE